MTTSRNPTFKAYRVVLEVCDRPELEEVVVEAATLQQAEFAARSAHRRGHAGTSLVLVQSVSSGLLTMMG